MIGLTPEQSRSVYISKQRIK